MSLPSSAETRLAWAARSWDAEVENSSRLAVRVNVVLTVALAFAGAGAKVMSDALADRPSGFLARAFLIGAAVGVVLIFVAFVRVLIKRDPRPRAASASSHLLPPEDLGGAPPDDQQDLQRAFLATAAAAYELHARNAAEKRRLAVAQQWLILGAALTLACGAAYTWYRGDQGDAARRSTQVEGGQRGRGEAEVGPSPHPASPDTR